MFRIRIGLNTDPDLDPAFKVNTDPDPAFIGNKDPDPNADFFMTDILSTTRNVMHSHKFLFIGYIPIENSLRILRFKSKYASRHTVNTKKDL